MFYQTNAQSGMPNVRAIVLIGKTIGEANKAILLVLVSNMYRSPFFLTLPIVFLGWSH